MNREVDKLIEKLGVHNNGIIQSIGALTDLAVVFEELEKVENVEWCEEKLLSSLALEESVTAHIAAFEELKKHIIARARSADDDNESFVQLFNDRVEAIEKKIKTMAQDVSLLIPNTKFTKRRCGKSIMRMSLCQVTMLSSSSAQHKSIT